MSEIGITVVGELRPDWLIALEAALDQARRDGWRLTTSIVMEGYPYVRDGEPKMSRWTVDPEEWRP